jgi:pyridoxal 5'-phosphate synthase pdxS subunit
VCEFSGLGGVARMSDPKMIAEIQAAVSIPVMAKVRIGHSVEAEVSPSGVYPSFLRVR